MLIQPITVETIDQIKPMIFDLATRYRKTLRGCRYADIRVEVDEGQSAAAENGGSKHSSKDYGFAVGIRALSGDDMVAPGYFGQSLGAADLGRLEQVVKEGLRHAHHRARANAERKAAIRGEFGPLADALTSTRLAPIEIHQDVVPAVFAIDPRSVPLEELVALTTEISRSCLELDSRVKYTFISAFTLLSRELLCSSEGANIDQGFAHELADPDQFIESNRSGLAWRAGLAYPEWDRLVAAWEQTTDVEARRAATFDLEALFNRQPTIIPLWYPNESWAFRPDAYDGWSETRGYGIVNKWSFLPADARAGL